MADHTSHSGASFADSLSRPQSPSMLYSMIPSAVKSRLPKLPSIRRSASMYGLKPRPKSADSSCPSSGSTTPRTILGSSMVWSGARAEGELYFAGGIEASEDEDATQVDKRNFQQHEVLDETRSGIGWKFANQGMSLLSLAAEESTLISQDPRLGNESFARQLYIHASIYLLRALPADLTPEEQLSVRSALPRGVVPFQLEGLGHASGSPVSGVTNQPSILHRTLASIIVQLFILFQFILPHVKYLLSSAYQYERAHKISEKVVSGSISTMDALGKRGLLASEAVLRIGDGKVGELMASFGCWLVEGVAGGIQEGLGQGMVIIRAASPVSEVISR